MGRDNPEADETANTPNGGYDHHEDLCQPRIMPQCPNACSRHGGSASHPCDYTQKGWRKAENIASPLQRSDPIVRPTRTTPPGSPYSNARSVLATSPAHPIALPADRIRFTECLTASGA